MSRGSRIEGAGLVLVLLVGAAFIASFALGLGGIGSRPPAAAESVLADPAPRTGRIEVLNASGRAGIARAITVRLRDAGFDVVFYGNATAAHGDSTIVLARTEDDDIARAVARTLDISRVATRADSALFLDATVVLGADWRAEVPVAPGREEGFGQRLRRWLTPGK